MTTATKKTTENGPLSLARLSSNLCTARETSVDLARTQPGASAWVYVFRTAGRRNARYGIRFSIEAEARIEDGADTIELEVVARFMGGERIA